MRTSPTCLHGKFQILRLLAPLCVGLLVAAPGTLRAGLERVQQIPLKKGWNSVFLAVTPKENRPEVLFANTPVEIAASYFVPTRPVEFIQNPGSIQWKQEGWAVWYTESRPDGFLSNMSAIYGNRAYLIYSTQDFIWNVRGSVHFDPVRWKPDSFNLAGFCLDDQSPPTFRAFFQHSAAHQACRIYRLNNGEWQLVADPLREQMRSGEAYWIYCKGGSDYQGPLSVKLPFGRELSLAGTRQVCINFANRGADPLKVTVETMTEAGGVPLAYVVTGIGKTNMADYLFDLPAAHSLPILESGSFAIFAIQVRPEKMTKASQDALLKISTDIGSQHWIPVTATRADLAPEP